MTDSPETRLSLIVPLKDRMTLWVMVPERDGGRILQLHMNDFYEPEKGG